MKLLTEAWIPVRDQGGSGSMELLTLEQLLCHQANWRISLPRDDLELAGLQLLICLVQVVLMPRELSELRERLQTPLPPEHLADAVAPLVDWFHLAHPVHPFMQTRRVKADKVTPIQKLLPGMPEGSSHAFFNAKGEVARLGAASCAIALFNKASCMASFGGGFKNGLRGGGPVTTLVAGTNLREVVWLNVVTPDLLPRSLASPSAPPDRPTWVAPIQTNQTVHAHQIGLMRGLFWQSEHLELIPSGEGRCDLLGGPIGPIYEAFRKEKFNFTMEGTWFHPHGAWTATRDKTTKALTWRPLAFSTTAPAWTQLREFVVPRSLEGGKSPGGRILAAPVTQYARLRPGAALHLLVGGYCTNQAKVVERRHEPFSLAQGWTEHQDHLEEIIDLSLQAKELLRGALILVAKGKVNRATKQKLIPGIGISLQQTGVARFFQDSEPLIHTRLRSQEWRERGRSLERLAAELSTLCRKIYDQLTEPHAAKPELIRAIAWQRRGLDARLRRLFRKE